MRAHGDVRRRAVFAVAVLVTAGCAAPLPSSSNVATPPSASVEATTSSNDQSPAPSGSAGGAWPSCEGEGFSISYPVGWFVRPPDGAAGIAECALFAAQPFEGTREHDGGWTGAQIVLRLSEGCQGSFEVLVAQEELPVEGYPAWARHLAVGEGPDAGEPSAYEYTVNLAPEDPCEDGRWFIGRTELAAPGDHVENSAILDRMMESVTFTEAD